MYMTFILIKDTWKLANKAVSNTEMGKTLSLPPRFFSSLSHYYHITILLKPDVWGFSSPPSNSLTLAGGPII